jgi:hypothetical protein
MILPRTRSEQKCTISLADVTITSPMKGWFEKKIPIAIRTTKIKVLKEGEIVPKLQVQVSL